MLSVTLEVLCCIKSDTGVILVLLFILSDFSSLKWRLFFSFVPTFPFIINTWISGDVTSALGMRWSWGLAYGLSYSPSLVSQRYVACSICVIWQVIQRNGKHSNKGKQSSKDWVFGVS
ncbi:unnamed protein product [Debaryomyces tyrocola]|nr:unnamed protein product [Debaryomyces tyrocola]